MQSSGSKVLPKKSNISNTHIFIFGFTWLYWWEPWQRPLSKCLICGNCGGCGSLDLITWLSCSHFASSSANRSKAVVRVYWAKAACLLFLKRTMRTFSIASYSLYCYNMFHRKFCRFKIWSDTQRAWLPLCAKKRQLFKNLLSLCILNHIDLIFF